MEIWRAQGLNYDWPLVLFKMMVPLNGHPVTTKDLIKGLLIFVFLLGVGRKCG